MTGAPVIHWRGALILLMALILCAVASREFLGERADEPIYAGPGVTAHRYLSDYFAPIRNSRADTDVFILEGSEPGGTMLVLGGTHPNEVAGYLASCILVENAVVRRGRLIVIPRANHSGFTCTEPGEGHPAFYDLPTPNGPRRFRLGCRFTNPLDQWPDPEVYLHYPSKQELSGGETRNLNRAFPGRADGNFTERAAFAITSLIRRENVDLVIDLHEASPEYPVINAMVAHERAMDLAAMANLALQSEGINLSLEPSPPNFHGLTHREIGDATGAMVVLLETANVMQGRLRGRTNAAKILSGRDDCYLAAAEANLLRVPYDSTGLAIEVRVGRHLAALRALWDALNSLKPSHALETSGLPDYAQIQARGVGAFLIPKNNAVRPTKG
jgi:predicted deacylase